MFPQGTVPVCIGDPLLIEFECTIAAGRQLLEWRINITLENETMVGSYYTRLIDTSGQVQMPLLLHSIVFSFATSAISPLMSTLSISGVTGNLTSIEVICVDRLERTSSSALIHVINKDQCKLLHANSIRIIQVFCCIVLNFLPTEINVTTESEQLDRDRILVILKWSEEPASDFLQLNLISYTINAIPQVAMRLLERTRVEMEVLYNIYYVVTIVGVPSCKADNITSSTILYYGMF